MTSMVRLLLAPRAALGHQVLLRVQRFPGASFPPAVRSVGAELPALDRISKRDAQNAVPDGRSERRFLHRNEHFDAAVEIPEHHIGATDEQLLVVAVREVVNALVLEEATDDGR